MGPEPRALHHERRRDSFRPMTVRAPVPDRRLLVAADEVQALWALAASVAPQPGSEGLAPRDTYRLADYFQILQRVSIRANDETCHQSRRPLAVGATDFIVETLAGAKTLEEAMRRVATAYNLMHGGAFNRVERRGGRLAYLIDDRHFPYAFPSDSSAAFATGEGLLIFLHAMLSLAVGRRLDGHLLSVRTRRPQREAKNGFLGFWPVAVRPRADVYALDYDIRASDEAVVLAPGSGRALDVYAEIAAMIAAREARLPELDIVSEVSAVLSAGVTGQTEAARRLGVSVATLRRRLDHAGTSFRRLRADRLNGRALALLGDRHHPSQVAEALGFSDLRSFSRAFKAWNGVTPASWAVNVSENVLID